MSSESVSTPPPDANARTVLEGLHPLLEPPPPGWMPQTAAWGVLAALALALALWGIAQFARRWHQQRHRRLALRQLKQLTLVLTSGQGSTDERLSAARQLPELVRRLSLAHAPRADVASLQGEDWLRWLDRTVPAMGQAFCQGPGRSLALWAYAPPSKLPWDDLAPMLSLLERWIRVHQVQETAA